MKKFLLAAVSASALCGAYSATAGTVVLDYTGFNNGSVNLTHDLDPVEEAGRRAGEFGLHVESDPTSILDGLTSILAFCLDLNVRLNTTAQVYHEASDPLDAGLNAKAVENLDLLFSNHYVIGGMPDSFTSAAFQAAVWEITYDSGIGDTLDRASGNYTLSGPNSVTSVFDTYIDSSTGKVIGNKSGLFDLTFLHTTPDGASQDLVTATPVPLPAAGLFLLGALAGLGAMRRRARV